MFRFRARGARAVVAVGLSLFVGLSPAMVGTAHADGPLPDCGDTDCGGGGDGGGGGVGGGGGGGGGAGPSTPPPVPSCVFTPQGEHAIFHGFQTIPDANDVAAGVDNSVWYTSSRGTFSVFSGRGVAKAGKRLAVDPSGLPWIVDFAGHIWRTNPDLSTSPMPGLARDIGIGGNGEVWVIGTNPVNDSFGVWHLVGGQWQPDPGSGESINVTAGGIPMVNGHDGKLWIKDGGPNQGWRQFGDQRAADIGLSPCARHFAADPDGTSLWIVGRDHDEIGETSNSVWSWSNAFGWQAQESSVLAERIAVDTTGEPWVVQGDADDPGELAVGNITNFLS